MQPAGTNDGTYGARPFPEPVSDEAAISWVVPVHTSGSAIAAGYMGLLGVVPGVGEFAIVFGILALKNIARTHLYGRGRAWFGILAGIFWTCIHLLILAATCIG